MRWKSGTYIQNTEKKQEKNILGESSIKGAIREVKAEVGLNFNPIDGRRFFLRLENSLDGKDIPEDEILGDIAFSDLVPPVAATFKMLVD